jgi:uncharacterized repeat protein (TIGR03803 family)
MNANRDTTSGASSMSTPHRRRAGRGLLTSLALLALVLSAPKAAGQGTDQYTVLISNCCTLLANQLNCPGGNTLTNIMPSLPCDVSLFKWDNGSQSWSTNTYSTVSGWDDSAMTLNPGEGAYLCSSCTTSFVVTFTGAVPTPVLPVPILPGHRYLVSRQYPGPGSYEDIVGSPPTGGEWAYAYEDCVHQIFSFDPDELTWYPNDPTTAIGEAIWILPPGTSGLPPIPILTPPSVSALSYWGVTATTANLYATVNPMGYPTAAWFQWGTTTNYGNFTAATDMGSGVSPLSLSVPIAGLTPGVTYHVCAVATNSNGAAYGSDVSFTTAGRPAVWTLSASAVTFSSAVLNATVNPNGYSTAAWFEWGTNTSYGNLTSVTDMGSGTAGLSLSIPLSGLIPGTTYHFRVAATNSNAAVYGTDQSFTTLTIVISAQPFSQTVQVGDTVQLSVTAEGSEPFGYQWFRNGVTMSDGGNIAGSQTATLRLTNVSSADAAGYCAVVTNAYGSVTSQVAALCGLYTNPPGYAVVHNFAGGAGGDGCVAGLVLEGSAFYGTTYHGGQTNLGTVFKVNLDGSDFTVLHSFNGLDGAWPYARMILLGGTLYGTTTQGGSNYLGGGTWGNGTVFKINTDGSGYTVLKSFTGYDDGDRPEGGLAFAGSTLYGTTAAGGQSVWKQGTVFKVNTDGSGFGVIHHFDGFDGAYPNGGMVLSGDTLYSTTTCNGILATNEYVGVYGNGVIFKLNTNGGNYTILRRFNDGEGSQPAGELLLSDNVLYGTTRSGGVWNYGTVFKIGLEGSDFAVLKHFTFGDGSWPEGGLVLADDTLYGTTSDGGAGAYSQGGILFKVNTDGSGFAVLRTFGGLDGREPAPDLVLSGTNLYGTTFYGGNSNRGVIFSLARPHIAVLSPPASQTAEQGSAVRFSAKVSGFPALTCQWMFNDIHPIDGGISSRLEWAGVQFDQGGAYTLVISNAVGTVTSAPALLNVIAPVGCRPVPGLQLTGEAGSSMSVDYADVLSGTPAWFPLGLMTLTSTSGYCFDLTLPLPAQRFYRARQTGAPSVIPSPGLHMVPALTLTGNIGDAVRVDYINRYGPIDAWVTLDMATLTNTYQLYFDTSAPGQPERLYRLVPIP